MQFASPFQCIPSAPRGEDPLGPGFYHSLQHDRQVTALIERAMKGCLHWGSKINQFYCTRNIDCLVPLQYSQNNPIHLQISRQDHRSLHLRKLFVAINKVAGAGPDHRMDWQSYRTARFAHDLTAGSQSAHMQICAQFDAVSSSTFGRRRRACGFDANFQNEFANHFYTALNSTLPTAAGGWDGNRSTPPGVR